MKTEEKLDKIAEDIVEIKVTLAEQAQQLKHHIYRSDLNEENIELLRTEVKPLGKHVATVNGVLKGIGGLAVLATIVKGVIEVVKFFS